MIGDITRIKREDCKRIILHSDKISFSTNIHNNLWYFVQGRQKENEEGKRTNMIVRTGKIVNASQSSKYDPI